MWKSITAAALVGASILSVGPAEAKICRDSHGERFHCHHVFAPRINFHDRHPIKVIRCRGHVGRFNNCTHG